MAKIVNSNEFKDIVNEGLVIVDFFATWCGPCKMIAPIFEELSKEYEGKMTFVKVDVDLSTDIAGKYGISSIPTMKILDKSEVKETMIGFLPKDALKEKIEKYL